MTIDELQQFIGLKYQKLDAEGKAFGCMAPVYIFHPDLPHYEWPDESNFSTGFLELLERHGEKVAKDEMLPGDVIAFKIPGNYLHVGVYLGDGKVIHCMRDDTMERCRLSLIERRIEGIFRWNPGGER